MKNALGYIIAGIVAIALGSCYLDARADALRAEGALAERVKDWATERDSLRLAAGKIDTVFRDRVRTFTRLDTLFQERITVVTNNITDTLTVREFIQIADSTVAACKAALSVCSLLNSNLSTQLVLSDSIIKAYKSQIPKPPGWFARTAKNVEHVLAGVGVVYLGSLVIRR